MHQPLAQTRWSDELDLSNESAWGMGLPLLACMEGARRLLVRACGRWALVHLKTAEGSSGLSFVSCICRKDAFGGKRLRVMHNSALPQSKIEISGQGIHLMQRWTMSSTSNAAPE